MNLIIKKVIMRAFLKRFFNRFMRFEYKYPHNRRGAFEHIKDNTWMTKYLFQL